VTNKIQRSERGFCGWYAFASDIDISFYGEFGADLSECTGQLMKQRWWNCIWKGKGDAKESVHKFPWIIKSGLFWWSRLNLWTVAKMLWKSRR